MKKLFLLSALCTMFLLSCEHKDVKKPKKENKDSVTTPSIVDEKIEFAKSDNSKKLSGKPAQSVFELLSMMETVPMIPLNNTTITDEQLAEIKIFTEQNIVKGKTTGKEKVNAIYNWVRTNVKYGPSDPSAYSTFINKEAVCQGYSNLFRVMCYTQNIPAFVANGTLFDYSTGRELGGHAWNYAFADSKWFVVDPTNSRIFLAKYLNQYEKKLVPQSIDFILSSDDTYEYSYINNALSISLIKEGAKEKLQIPYSVNKLKITNFNPSSIPANVTEIYLGENIEKLGDKYATNILKATKELTGIFVAPENTSLESYNGTVVYHKNDYKMPICVAGKAKVIELKATPVIDKNTVYDHKYVEKMVFAEGTKTISSYAVENCPNLKEIILPTSIEKVEENAFDKCHADLKIIRK